MPYAYGMSEGWSSLPHSNKGLEVSITVLYSRSYPYVAGGVCWLFPGVLARAWREVASLW